MSRTFKVVLILLVVASISSAVLAVFTFLEKEREYTKRILLEEKLAATLKDKRRLEKNIEAYKKEKEEAESGLQELETKISALTAEIDEQKERHESVALELAAREKELAGLQKDLEQERKEKSKIAEKLEELQFDYDKAKSDISKLKSQRERLEKERADLKEKSVELDKIVVTPSASSMAAVPAEAIRPAKDLLKGKVLVVNKDYNFVVTDLGQDDGIKKGLLVDIKEGGVLLGRAEIDKVYDTMSSANVLPGADINNIKKGNLVIESR